MNTTITIIPSADTPLYAPLYLAISILPHVAIGNGLSSSCEYVQSSSSDDGTLALKCGDLVVNLCKPLTGDAEAYRVCRSREIVGNEILLYVGDPMLPLAESNHDDDMEFLWLLVNRVPLWALRNQTRNRATEELWSDITRNLGPSLESKESSCKVTYSKDAFTNSILVSACFSRHTQIELKPIQGFGSKELEPIWQRQTDIAITATPWLSALKRNNLQQVRLIPPFPYPFTAVYCKAGQHADVGRMILLKRAIVESLSVATHISARDWQLAVQVLLTDRMHYRDYGIKQRGADFHNILAAALKDMLNFDLLCETGMMPWLTVANGWQALDSAANRRAAIDWESRYSTWEQRVKSQYTSLYSYENERFCDRVFNTMRWVAQNPHYRSDVDYAGIAPILGA